MELALSIVGLVLAVAVAIFEYRRANKAEAALEKAFAELPGRLVADMSRMFGSPVAGPSEASGELPGVTTRYADLNGDGRDELLVEYVSGPHHMALQVFGMRTPWEFGLLGEIYGTTPTDFDIEDVDGDGIPEVSVVEIAKAPDLPYVMGLRDRVTYKLMPEGFVEVKREEGYTVEDLKAVLSEWHRDDA